MKILKIDPSPKIGAILSILLHEVIEDPERNNKKYLEEKAKELLKLSDKDLQNFAKKAKVTKDEFESGEEEKIKKQYYVK